MWILFDFNSDSTQWKIKDYPSVEVQEKETLNLCKLLFTLSPWRMNKLKIKKNQLSILFYELHLEIKFDVECLAMEKNFKNHHHHHN